MKFCTVSVSTVLQIKTKTKQLNKQKKKHRAIDPADFLSLLYLPKKSVGSKLLYLAYLCRKVKYSFAKLCSPAKLKCVKV